MYLLAHAALKPIVGNIEAWPAEVKPKPGWNEVSLVIGGRLRTVQIEEVSMPGGFHLLVGRDMQDLAEVRSRRP